MDDRQTVCLGRPQSDTGVILLHGFGADMHDLADLVPFLDPEAAMAWYLPQAPYNLGPQMWAWFPKDPHTRTQALYGQYFSRLEDMDDPGLDQALAFMEDLMNGTTHRKWLVAGFSQGAMVASHLLSASLPRLAGAMLFSPALFARHRFSAVALAQGPDQRVPVFISHGFEDPILSHGSACRLQTLLGDRGHQTEFFEFHGGHGIPAEALVACRNWLGKLGF